MSERTEHNLSGNTTNLDLNDSGNSQFKSDLYKWHYISDGAEGREDKLVAEEVSPGVVTFIEPNKYKEYQAITPYVVLHHTYQPEDIALVIKEGGLLSTKERRRRGIMTTGINSDIDIQTGVADNVFTRIYTPSGLKNSKAEAEPSGVINLIFEPDVMDRLDWYAFTDDRYGGTDPKTFDARISPEQLFQTQKDHYDWGNEQVFLKGIPLEKIKYIACRSRKEVKDLLEAFEKFGITIINDKSLDQVIVIAPTKLDIFQASQEESAPRPEIVKGIMEEFYKQRDARQNIESGQQEDSL
jgi:hypothetical protein